VIDGCRAGLAKDGVNPPVGPPPKPLPNPPGAPAPKTIAAISLLQIFIFTLLEKFNCATQTLWVLTCYILPGNNYIGVNHYQNNK
jgi:hypothetical protein